MGGGTTAPALDIATHTTTRETIRSPGGEEHGRGLHRRLVRLHELRHGGAGSHCLLELFECRQSFTSFLGRTIKTEEELYISNRVNKWKKYYLEEESVLMLDLWGMLVMSTMDPDLMLLDRSATDVFLSLLDLARADLSKLLFPLLPPGSDLEGEPFLFLGPIWGNCCLQFNLGYSCVYKYVM
jgi:hypothetical protein